MSEYRLVFDDSEILEPADDDPLGVDWLVNADDHVACGSNPDECIRSAVRIVRVDQLEATA